MTEASPSTSLPLGRMRLTGLSTSRESASQTVPSRPSVKLSRLHPIPKATRRTLDFDLECVAAGYADPQWVPSTVTAWAYTWIGFGSPSVVVEALPVESFYDLDARRRFLLPLLAAIEEADVLTGHNIIRFDLPVLNAECLRLGLPLLQPVLAQDTIRLPKSKGFKKGQDNMAHALGVPEEKLPLNWAQWQAAYGEPDLATVKERCASDVLMHVEMRQAMKERGWLTSPRLWRP